MTRGVRTFRGLRERVRAFLHFHLPMGKAKVEEARRAIDGRKYYERYDDLYHKLRNHGGSAQRDERRSAIHELARDRFDDARRGDLLMGSGARLFDIGCGEGANTIHFALQGYAVTGVDISPVAISVAKECAAHARTQAAFQTGDALSLTHIEDGSFDIVADFACLHMLVRSEDRRRYLATVRRVLQPSGRYFLFAHASPRDVRIRNEDAHILRMTAWRIKRWSTNDGEKLAHGGCAFRSASLRQYERELGSAGFRVLRTWPRYSARLPFAALVSEIGPQR